MYVDIAAGAFGAAAGQWSICWGKRNASMGAATARVYATVSPDGPSTGDPTVITITTTSSALDAIAELTGGTISEGAHRARAAVALHLAGCAPFRLP